MPSDIFASDQAAQQAVLSSSSDGAPLFRLPVKPSEVWMTARQIAELFQTDVRSINEHIQDILDDHEVLPGPTVRKYQRAEADGSQIAEMLGDLYNLDLILAIGYRVRSPRGTQFRKWATTHLREFLVKGFVLDDARLKDPRGWDHFDELLARIREIRASEKRFYQKVRDLFALSSDYQATDRDTTIFFANIQNKLQNKLLYAATRKTAAELIVARADASQPNMSLTTWRGSRVRKEDVVIAKNYLTHDEIDTLNRLVVIFLEQAELRVKNRHDLTLAFWRENIDAMLRFSDRPVLDGPGSVSHDDMVRIAGEHYETFSENRRIAEAAAADAEDLRQIEELDKELKQKQEHEKQEKQKKDDTAP